MGFSVTMASSIVLAGLILFTGSLFMSLLYSLYTSIGVMATYVDGEKARLGVKLEAEIEDVGNFSIQLNVKNVGSKPIFLQEDGYRWNSIIVSYNTSTSRWVTYLIEDYTILEVRVTGTNVSFNPAGHRFLEPGEEARIAFHLPNGAPEIPAGGVVTVVFASHYGVSARDEAVRGG